MTRRYHVVYENGPGNLSEFAPDVPGCARTGRSFKEMRVNLREALECHLMGLALDGLSMPAAETRLVRCRKRDSRSGWWWLPEADAISA